MPKLAINGGTPVRTAPFPGWPPDDPMFLEGLREVIDSKVWGTGGTKVPELCERFAAYHDAQFGVAVTSGTLALQVALQACGIGASAEVIVPPYTFIATATSVIAANAIPVFADIDRDTMCLDPKAIEAAITPSTAAIIPVHIGGMPADMDAIKAVAAKHGLVVIEDCAQAHGAVYRGKKVGALGDMGAFSLQSSKNVTAGEGGLVLTNDRAKYGHAWSIANVGRVPEGGWYDHRLMGWNLRLTEFQAALALRGLELLPGHMERRDACATRLMKRFDEIEGIGYQAFSDGAERSAWHLFIGTYDAEAFEGVPRDRFLAALSAEGVPCSGGYNPLYREGLFRDGWDPESCPWACTYYKGTVDYNSVSCPNCEELCEERGFWLFQSMLLGTEEDMDDIADAVVKVKENVGELRS
jgi:dTDP-4-amino-4,6-dideoxygalactose transaminase